MTKTSKFLSVIFLQRICGGVEKLRIVARGKASIDRHVHLKAIPMYALA